MRHAATLVQLQTHCTTHEKENDPPGSSLYHHGAVHRRRELKAHTVRESTPARLPWVQVSCLSAFLSTRLVQTCHVKFGQVPNDYDMNRT